MIDSEEQVVFGEHVRRYTGQSMNLMGGDTRYKRLHSSTTATFHSKIEPLPN
jgi:hypothetical protein